MDADMAARLLQQLAESNEGLRNLIQQQAVIVAQNEQRSRDELETIRQAMKDQQGLLAEAIRKASERPSANRCVVDVKAVGKPDRLSGGHQALLQQWNMWAFTFSTWFASQWPVWSDVLEWAAHMRSIAITKDVIQDRIAAEPTWSWLEDIDSQFYVALVSLTGDDALSVVRSSEKGSGLDEWRRLWDMFDSNNPV
jgi:hypothetical protein